MSRATEGSLPVIGYRRYALAYPCAALALLASSVEVLQSLTITRDPGIADLGADLLGVVVGVATACVALRVLPWWRAAAGCDAPTA